MKNVNRFFFKPSTIALLSVLLFAAGLWMRGQAVQAQTGSQPLSVGGVQITGLPDDWTHHHLVFSNPGTEEEATQHGKHEKWSSTVNDPRYVIQQLQRHALAQGPAATAVAQMERLRTLGTTGTKDAGITAGPLLWQALRKPWRTLDRENPRALAIAGLQLAILILALAFAAASFRRRQWAPTLLLMLSTAVFVSLASCGGAGTSNSGGTSDSGGSASGSSGGAASGQLNQDWQVPMLTGAVLPNAYPAKYTFNPIGPASCTDYVVYPTGSAGSSTQATIIAYNELYGTNTPTETGCGTASVTVPTVYWAYNTGAATVTTSPVLSLDGSKVAFIQTTGASASLVVLKFSASGRTVSTPVTPATSTNITTCSAPCMTVTSLGATAGDTYSSPYYDYSSDILYVGDNASHLYQATGVFNGATSPTVLSVTLTNGTGTYAVASPVYDSTSGCVFVGDTDGYLYSVDSGLLTGSVCTSGSYQLHATSNILGNSADVAPGIFDAPLVDQTAEMVYVFVNDSASFTQTLTGGVTSGSINFTATSGLTQQDVNLSITGGGIPGGDTIATVTSATAGTLTTAASVTHASESLTIANCALTNNCVDQFSASFANGAAPNAEQAIGGGGVYANGPSTLPLYDGAFDNVYYSSGSSTPSGNIYVVGGTNAHAAGEGNVNLYRVAITSNAMGPVTTAVPKVASAGQPPWPSPVTEFCNNGASACAVTNGATTSGSDYVFFSVYRGNLTSTCSSAGQSCLYSYIVNSNPSGTVTTATTGDKVTWVSGQQFNTSGAWNGLGIVINSVAYTISSVTNATTLSLTTSPGTQTAAVPYSLESTLSSSVPLNNSGGTSGHGGCWDTGGFVIDNSSTSAGASQIYFVYLGDNFSAGAPSSCNSSSGNSTTNTINAVQAQQSNVSQ